MTCIAAIIKDGKSYMAGERAATDDHMMSRLNNPKIWEVGEYLMGFCGTFEGQIIQANFVPPKVEGNLDKFMRGKFIKAINEFYKEYDIPGEKESELTLLICIRGKMYEHEAATLSMISYDMNYHAIGSGSAYAMGSLHATQNYKDPKRRLTQALDAAINYSPNCLYPIDILAK